MELVELVQGGGRPLILLLENLTHIIPDSLYLKIMYRIRLGKKLNINIPKTFNEKLQWLKLHDRKEIYTKMVDKYEVKSIIGECIGYEHVIPTLGVWDSFDAIDFEKLPSQFVLKCNHDSGSVIVVKDKALFDKEDARMKLTAALRRNYYWSGREWPYKNVKRRIIAEPYISSLANYDSKEYKITCFNGKLAFGTICTGIAHSKLNERKNDFYDPEFNILPFWSYYKHSDNPVTEKPEHYDEMVMYAEKISRNIPYLRVDFYVLDNRVYFGEATFYTWGGFNKFVPEEWDEILGEQLDLSMV